MGVCDSDFECRTDEGYRCDPFLRFCSPPMPVLLRVSADFEPTELCDQDIEEPEDVDSEVEPDDIESTGGSDTGEEITSLNSGS